MLHLLVCSSFRPLLRMLAVASAPSLPFSSPAFESDHGLPVPWSLIVQGEELPKAFPRVWRVHPVPCKPWRFRTCLSFPRFVLLPGTQCCVLTERPSSLADPCLRSLWAGRGGLPSWKLSLPPPRTPSHILSPTTQH